MASVINRITKEFLESVNTPDYSPTDWIINPDLSSVNGILEKYWIINGNTVRPATTEEQSQIDELADYQGLTITEIKAKINNEINVYRDTYIDEGVIFNGHLFDSDQRARENIMGMSNAISLGIPISESFTWRSQLNEDVPMNADSLTAFGVAMLSFVSACFAKSWHLKDTMNAMTSTDVLDYINYDYTTGWPSNSMDGSALQSNPEITSNL